MKPFTTIYDEAVALHPQDDIELLLPTPKSAKQLKAKDDAWYLSLISRRVFRAGLKHSMVDSKWPAFEQVFYGFDVDRVRMMSDEALEKLMQYRRIIRHWGKIKSVRSNAAAMYEQRQHCPSFGTYLAKWPDHEIIGLWEDLKKQFKQMGGHSGPYFLRMAGKDTFLLTNDVVRALNRWGVYSGTPKSMQAKQTVQAAFNTWANQSNRPLCQISRILALSVDSRIVTA